MGSVNFIRFVDIIVDNEGFVNNVVDDNNDANDIARIMHVPLVKYILIFIGVILAMLILLSLSILITGFIMCLISYSHFGTIMFIVGVGSLAISFIMLSLFLTFFGCLR